MNREMKAKQKQAIIDMMKEDEEFGLYDCNNTIRPQYDWQCAVCGKVLTPLEVRKRHVCSGTTLSNKAVTNNSVILNGIEYWVNMDKLNQIKSILNL